MEIKIKKDLIKKMRKQSFKRKVPIKTQFSNHYYSYQPMGLGIQEGTVRISSFPGLDFKNNKRSFLKAMSDFIEIRFWVQPC